MLRLCCRNEEPPNGGCHSERGEFPFIVAGTPIQFPARDDSVDFLVTLTMGVELRIDEVADFSLERVWRPSIAAGLPSGHPDSLRTRIGLSSLLLRSRGLRALGHRALGY
jgi:hypothetical protein